MNVGSFFKRLLVLLSGSQGSIKPVHEWEFNSKNFGCFPDKTDARDALYEITPASAAGLAPFFSLMEFASPIKNQGLIGSCVPHVAAAMYYSELKRLQGVEFDGSEMQLYYDGRILGNLFPQDVGMYPRDVFKVMQKQGIAPESMHRYDEFKLNNPPSAAARGWQRYFKIESYHQVPDLNTAKQQIMSGHTLGINIPIHKGFQEATVQVRVPEKKEKPIGYHELQIIAYEDQTVNDDGTKGAFFVQNSWGPGWGMGGRSWLPYSYLKAPGTEQTSIYSIRIAR